MVQARLARYLTFCLAAVVMASDGLYIAYLDRGHHMLRWWSGLNSLLLGVFLVAWAVVLHERGGRWSAATFVVIGVLNVIVGVLFFL